ncbi:hypothetical protein [Blastococcus litoris]|uniref:hypothetical protein n=1 Tax=Blastococcus litoris TaxID=2171622 RepID=UPI0019D1E5D7|nr:hypothetical protein [Blastococcus litoris]
MTRPAGEVVPPEVRRAQTGTWVGLLLITVGTAFGAFFVDADVDPLVPGLFAVVAAVEVWLALRWWRSRRRRR